MAHPGTGTKIVEVEEGEDDKGNLSRKLDIKEWNSVDLILPWREMQSLAQKRQHKQETANVSSPTYSQDQQ